MYLIFALKLDVVHHSVKSLNFCFSTLWCSRIYSYIELWWILWKIYLSGQRKESFWIFDSIPSNISPAPLSFISPRPYKILCLSLKKSSLITHLVWNTSKILICPFLLYIFNWPNWKYKLIENLKWKKKNFNNLSPRWERKLKRVIM